MSSRLREFGETPPEDPRGIRIWLSRDEIYNIVSIMESDGAKNAPYNLLVSVLEDLDRAEPRTF